MLKEFREFIARGNVLDLAIGVVIGAAFKTIVDSFVADLLSPILGLFGKADFKDQFVVLKSGSDPKILTPYNTLADAKAAGAVTLNYGAFLTNVINFLIVAFALFLIVKAANRFRRQEPEAAAEPPEPTREEVLLTEIRDLLRRPA